MDQLTISRFDAALSSDTLTALALEMRDAGQSQEEVEALFTEFLDRHADDSPAFDAVFEVLDMIAGYCNPAACLFPPPRFKDTPRALKFFATTSDALELFLYIQTQTPLRIFRACSDKGPDLEVRSLSDLKNEIGEPSKAASKYYSPTHFSLWKANASPNFRVEARQRADGKTHWMFASDPRFHLFLGGQQNGVLSVSEGSYGSVRARPLLEILATIRQHIRQHLSVATARGVPVLRNAYEQTTKGVLLKTGFQTTWAYPIDNISNGDDAGE